MTERIIQITKVGKITVTEKEMFTLDIDAENAKLQEEGIAGGYLTKKEFAEFVTCDMPGCELTQSRIRRVRSQHT